MRESLIGLRYSAFIAHTKLFRMAESLKFSSQGPEFYNFSQISEPATGLLNNIVCPEPRVYYYKRRSCHSAKIGQN
jgi:hypothetical protein